MMNTNNNWMTLSEFGHQVQRYCEQRCTGTLFGVTDANQSVVMVLAEGNITGVMFRARSGRMALEQLQTVVSRLRFNLTKSALLRVDPELPETSEILEMLGVSTGSSQGLLEAEQFVRDMIVREACRLFGPVATLLCDDVLARQGIPQNRTHLVEVATRIAEKAGMLSKSQSLVDRLFSATSFETVQYQAVA